MFVKGNRYGKGRPKISLNRPELLLPIILLKSHINWANDFCRLYKKHKETGVLNKDEKERFRLLQELLPYLCSKIQLKDLDAQKFTTPEDSKAIARQTSELLKALEKETDVAKPTAAAPRPETGLADGKSSLPPPTEPA